MNKRDAEDMEKPLHILFVSPYSSKSTMESMYGGRPGCRVVKGLLRALDNLSSHQTDIVILSHSFHPKALRVFAGKAGARGFHGLVLRESQPLHESKDPSLRVRVSSAQGRNLSAMEIDIVAEISEGHSNQYIADSLNKSLGSVKAAIQNIFLKLGVRTRAQVIRIMLEPNSDHVQNIF